MKCALSIAGSDPTGGAGLQADLQVFSAFGVHGAGVVTALTLQDSAKVHSVMPVFPSVALDQIRVLLADITPSAVKVGMLATDDVARMVQLGLANLGADVPRVIDPVLAASDGTPLLERRAWPVLREIMHGAELVTPNIPEAELLSETSISGAQDCERAARIFIEDFGCRGVLIKGGHSTGPPDDLLAFGGESGISFHWLGGERIDVGAVHGTGCALASGITAGLALGHSLERAVADARQFVVRGLLNAASLGNGARFLGPKDGQ
ncbi:MAG: bifunctional hydroxymethylpyrimidine kinase/phosphomethylpyrimidine kinase [Myxococcota bacterium]|nr:bifunctional hydroxymethylpyrimidine kinase/phosphomethylpyrimidine kinase [Myxococcota bacterium]